MRGPEILGERSVPDLYVKSSNRTLVAGGGDVALPTALAAIHKSETDV